MTRDFIPSPRCFELQRSALQGYLPRIPAPLRRDTNELQASLIAHDRGLATHAPRDTICLVTVPGTAAARAAGFLRARSGWGIAVSEDQGLYSGVVPDGVATVTLDFGVGRRAR